MEIESLAATVSDINLKAPIVASAYDSIHDVASLMKEKKYPYCTDNRPR